MDVATYTGCRYEGGFTGMKASNRATLILSDDRVTLTRPRVLIGSRKNNVMKLWTALERRHRPRRGPWE